MGDLSAMFDQFGPPVMPQQIDYEQKFAPMFQQIAEQQAPAPQAVPPAPGMLQSFAAQFGGNLATENSGNPFYQQQVAGTLHEARQRTQQAEDANYQTKTRFDERKYGEIAARRMKLLELKLDDDIKRGDLEAANKNADRLAKIHETIKREDEKRAETSKTGASAQEHKYKMEEIDLTNKGKVATAAEKKQGESDANLNKFQQRYQQYLATLNKLPGKYKAENKGFWGTGLGSHPEEWTDQGIRDQMKWLKSAHDGSTDKGVKEAIEVIYDGLEAHAKSLNVVDISNTPAAGPAPKPQQ